MKKPKKRKKKAIVHKYTHKDSSGMRWRFKGTRPVSELADKVMRDCGVEWL